MTFKAGELINVLDDRCLRKVLIGEGLNLSVKFEETKR